MYKSKIEKVKIKDIIIPKERLRAIQDEESSLSLKKSIEKYGVLQPAILRRTVNGYELIAGESRVKYAEQQGVKEIEARVYEELDDLDAKIISIVENRARGQISLQQFINTIEEMHSKGYNVTEIAELLGYDKSYISRFLKLKEQPPQLKQAVLTGLIDINVADEITKIKDENRKLDTMETVFTMASTHNREEQLKFIKHYGRRICDKCGKEGVELFQIGDLWVCKDCIPEERKGEELKKEIYLDRLQCFLGLHETERYQTSTVFICRECLEKLEHLRNMIKAILGLKFTDISRDLLEQIAVLMLEERERLKREIKS